MIIDPLSPAGVDRVSQSAGKPAAASSAQASEVEAAFDNALQLASVARGSKSGELEPLQKFEGFVLRTFVESMLPKENTSFFGEGTAGEIWRSMLAERIGDEIAAGGGIGIAEMLAGDPTLRAQADDAGETLADEGLAARMADARADRL